jgi:hypothetical protein
VLKTLEITAALGRRQGMRLGALFSSVLDPLKPPLFGAGADLALLPQEEWHPSVKGTPFFESLLSNPVQARLHGAGRPTSTCAKCFAPLVCRALLPGCHQQWRAQSQQGCENILTQPAPDTSSRSAVCF